MEKFDIKGLYDEWFLDYASYVILERAIPNIDDGLKPVQRRILHSMSIIDDGRFNKVANIIGHTMQYHPHGDAAIGDAIVKIGQKQFLIETQGNWGNINTGDKAAAARYIEAKLSDFAKDILFNKEITNWKDSYDGRNNEPIQLPSKFPLILLQGAEGIAVGLSTKILPHNFKEITKALIASINGKNIKILPDFITGGIADFSKYNGGFKGSKVKIRAEIDIDEDKNLIIRSVPYNVTTQSLIESIVKANDSGKIKIRKIEDNTAEKVEIKIILTKGVSPHVTMDALFAFTSCEVTISPNCCLIVNNKPTFLKVEEIIKWYSDQTKEIFSKELNLELEKLNKKWHFLSLKKLFIENKVYQKIEDCSTWDEIINTIMKAMMLLAGKIKKSLTKEDIIQLTEIKIKTISKFDMEKIADEIHRIEENILEVENNIKHIDQYTIRYYEMLLDKYGELHKRRTVVSSLDSIEVKQVAVSNKKLLVDKKEGFIGTKITSGEYLSPCSDIDDIIIFRKNGNYKIVSIAEKVFVGNDIVHAEVWKKNDSHLIYNLIYTDNKLKVSYAKRFSVTAAIKDKDYIVSSFSDNVSIKYLSSNPNSESEVVNIFLNFKAKSRKKMIEYDFSQISIKSKNSKGNIVSKYLIRKIDRKSLGESSLGGRKIWIDMNIGKLNTNEMGDFLGSFKAEDSILVVYNDGSYEVTDFQLTNHYRIKEIKVIKKFNSNIVLSCIHYNFDSKSFYVKRFKVETTSLNKRFSFITENPKSRLIFVTAENNPKISFKFYSKNKELKSMELSLSKHVSIKGWKSIGNKLGAYLRPHQFTLVHFDEYSNESIDKLKDKEELNLFNSN